MYFAHFRLLKLCSIFISSLVSCCSFELLNSLYFLRGYFVEMFSVFRANVEHILVTSLCAPAIE